MDVTNIETSIAIHCRYASIHFVLYGWFVRSANARDLRNAYTYTIGWPKIHKEYE